MTQLAGWRFLELGRRIERAHPDLPAGAHLRASRARPTAASMCCSRLADSQITYRQRYVMVAARAPVIDLVMLDPNNPRSVAFQLDRIETHLVRPAAAQCHRPPVAGAADRRLDRDAAAHRRGGRGRRRADLIDVEQSLMKLSDAISAAYLTNNERSESVWEALA